jgi:hypothetical protein
MTDPYSPWVSQLRVRLEALLKLGLSHILDPSTINATSSLITEKVWQQATLPPRLGGLGIVSPTSIHLPANLAASIASSTPWLKIQTSIKCFHTLQPAQNATIPVSVEQIQELLTTDGSSERLNWFKEMIDEEDHSKLSLEYITKATQATLQSQFSDLLHTHTLRIINSSWSTPDLNRLSSCSQEGGIIITALPTYKDFRINLPHAFRERLLMRFGLPNSQIPSGQCICDNIHSIDKQGYHLLSVCKVGNQRQTTHNAVRDSLAQLCQYAGLVTRKETSETLQLIDIDNNQRLDIVCDNFNPGVALNIDVSVTDPRQLSIKRPVPGRAAQIREAEKMKKYSGNITRAGSLFSPFVLESFGRWGDSARDLFSHLMEKVPLESDQSFLPKSWISHFWKAKITMAMHKQACFGMHSRIKSIILNRSFPLSINLQSTNLPIPTSLNSEDLMRPFHSLGFHNFNFGFEK